MALNIDFIKRNGLVVYNILANTTRCSFNELQKICKLNNIDLCLALADLMREKKIQQGRDAQEVFYACA